MWSQPQLSSACVWSRADPLHTWVEVLLPRVLLGSSVLSGVSCSAHVQISRRATSWLLFLLDLVFFHGSCLKLLSATSDCISNLDRIMPVLVFVS